MYKDRWDLGHSTYVDHYLSSLISDSKLKFCTNIEEFILNEEYIKICDLSSQHLIGTDEPIRKYIKDTNIPILRPLFGIFESDIKDYFSNLISFQESECSIRKLKNFREYTPREMVHHLILDYVPLENMEKLLSIIIKELDTDGFSLVDVRNNRDTILGKQYKSNGSNSLKL
jgi:hypothetical protein